MSQENYDYAAELLTQCVAGDPANFIYLQAVLINLKKKYNNNKKGSNLAFIQGRGENWPFLSDPRRFWPTFPDLEAVLKSDKSSEIQMPGEDTG